MWPCMSLQRHSMSFKVKKWITVNDSWACCSQHAQQQQAVQNCYDSKFYCFIIAVYHDNSVSQFEGGKLHTEEVVSREMICIPDLKVESSWNLSLCLVPWEHVIPAWYDDLLLGHEVVKWKHESPVEIAFSCQRSVQKHNITYTHRHTHTHPHKHTHTHTNDVPFQWGKGNFDSPRSTAPTVFDRSWWNSKLRNTSGTIDPRAKFGKKRPLGGV